MHESPQFLPWLRTNNRLAVQVALSAALIYGLCWNVTAPDLKTYLFPWLAHILSAGRMAAFAQPFSNYTPPYLYLMTLASLVTTIPLAVVKSLSILATLAAASAVRRVLLPSRQANEAALLVVLLPTVLANGIVYGQCDGFWTAACLLAAASAMPGRVKAMLVWFGIGFAFKAQAMFLAPFLLAGP